jgi:lactate/malate dehydrogenase, NAD binding domain
VTRDAKIMSHPGALKFIRLFCSRRHLSIIRRNNLQISCRPLQNFGVWWDIDRLYKLKIAPKAGVRKSRLHSQMAPPSGIGRVAIIGAGSVGSTCAYVLLLRRITSEILLVDIDSSLQQAQVQDLSDAAFLSNTKVLPGTFREAGQCDIIVVTAGAKQRDGESRIDLLDRNYIILDSVIKQMKPFRSDAVLLLVSNPVDVLTCFAQKMSDLPRSQVIGSGTFLDTIRLRSSLAEQAQVRST